MIALASFWGLQNSRNPAVAPGHSASAHGSIPSRVDPGLVDIVTTLSYQQAQAAGTGMVLTRSGEVLTNNHVIEGATSIRVTDIGNGRTYRAVVLGYDRSHDVAVLQLRDASGLWTVRTGNSATAAVGQKVTGIGNAGRQGRHAVGRDGPDRQRGRQGHGVRRVGGHDGEAERADQS